MLTFKHKTLANNAFSIAENIRSTFHKSNRPRFFILLSLDENAVVSQQSTFIYSPTPPLICSLYKQNGLSDSTSAAIRLSNLNKHVTKTEEVAFVWDSASVQYRGWGWIAGQWVNYLDKKDAELLDVVEGKRKVDLF